MSNDESEEALLVSPKSNRNTIIATGGMPYTDGLQSATSGSGGGGGAIGGNSNLHQSSGQSSANSRTTRAGSQQSHESETGELIEYNDDIIMSQFHADAIKQVKVTDLAHV